ncbi:hypothetical protein [Cohnella herbarum]|uniref:Uncharacterized protein n=1 Tax=Cohnella herbarum TaxID=2728023 RepID=A0A7Z2VKN8_9BACL|nr:hypothetical protein [Cohnella herbarum]QJD84819.1 hypothetical protein HH215_17595 [Cohnella herbarum]
MNPGEARPGCQAVVPRSILSPHPMIFRTGISREQLSNDFDGACGGAV